MESLQCLGMHGVYVYIDGKIYHYVLLSCVDRAPGNIHLFYSSGFYFERLSAFAPQYSVCRGRLRVYAEC